MVTEEELEPGDENLTFFDFQIKHGMLLIGSPENVAAQIERSEHRGRLRASCAVPQYSDVVVRTSDKEPHACLRMKSCRRFMSREERATGWAFCLDG